MKVEEEKQLLEAFLERAKKGELVTIKQMKQSI